jgi:hypothetical protein
MSLGKVCGVKKEGDACKVTYDSGKVVTYYSCLSKVKASIKNKNSSASTNSGSTASHSSNYNSPNYHGNGHNYNSVGYGNHTSYSSYSGATEMKAAFEVDGIEFYGGPRHTLDKVTFSEDGSDLIINCTGTKWTAPKVASRKKFVLDEPGWIPSEMFIWGPEPLDKHGDKAQQIVFDWEDFKAPPSAVDIHYWVNLIDLIHENKIKRVYCCCAAGQGRTGTLLSSLLLATGTVEQPNDAISFIRKNYNSRAVENKLQEDYIFNLIYEEVKE